MDSNDDATFPVQRDHVTQLSPFTGYTFIVRAGNALDDVILWSNWSNSTSVVTDIARALTALDFCVLFNCAILCKRGLDRNSVNHFVGQTVLCDKKKELSASVLMSL